MCGIAGYTGPEIPGLLERMNASIRHRGPDGEGHFEKTDLHLCMRRLAIIDIEGGQQPQMSDDGEIALFFNGEIYNYVELRAELEGRGRVFKTRSSDTEVLLRMYEEYGLGMLDKLVGMFAIAIWDGRLNELLLIRDRLGKKPIYYHCDADRIAFSSEFNGLDLRDRNRNLDLDSLSWYFSQKAMPTSSTIDKRVSKVPPGCYLRWKKEGVSELKRYYSLATRPPCTLSEQDVIKKTENLIEESVRIRMRADVEVGAYLSGGLDSSLIVALASRLSTRSLKTYCLTYEDNINHKAEDRRRSSEVSRLFKTSHQEVLLTPEILAQELPRIVAHYGQPNSAVISNWFISREMGKDLKVALSGDGADELFGSYFLHRFAAGVEQPTASLSKARTLPEVIDQFSIFSDRDQASLFASGKFRSGSLLASLNTRLSGLRSTDPLNRMLEFDCQGLLVDQVLNYSDMLSMAHSLEVRTPYLDHRLVDFAFSLDHRFKIRDGVTKYLLKEVAKKHLPIDLINRPKEGFVEPAVYWIHRPLRDFCLSYLKNPGFNRLGLLDGNYVTRIVDGFYSSGDFQAGKKVWNILMFAIWEQTLAE